MAGSPIVWLDIEDAADVLDIGRADVAALAKAESWRTGTESGSTAYARDDVLAAAARREAQRSTPDSVTVDARLSGGHLLIEVSPLRHVDIAGVTLTAPGYELQLFPHEALALAAALTAAAERSEQLEVPC